MKPGGVITVRHPGSLPPVSFLCEDDAIVVEHNWGEHGEPGNIVRVWLKDQKTGRIWIQRNSSPEEIKGGGDRSLYEDWDGDGIVDYKRNGDGVFRVAEIVWEKIGSIPDVPPDEPNHRIDTHRSASGLEGSTKLKPEPDP